MIKSKWYWRLFMRWTYGRSKYQPRPRLADDHIGLEWLNNYASTEARSWSYVNDKIYGIFNHITAPPKAEDIKSGDCDDFASKMYHACRWNEPLLVTFFTKDIKHSHTVMICKIGVNYVLVNWSRVLYSRNFTAIISELDVYASRRGTTITSVHFARYNYKAGKFYPVNVKQFKSFTGSTVTVWPREATE